MECSDDARERWSGLAQEFQLSLFTSAPRPSLGGGPRQRVRGRLGEHTQDGGTSASCRRFTSGGDGIGGEFRVNAYTPGGQSDPIVAAEANGDFVVIWSSQDQDGDQNGVFARRFSSAGTALGSSSRCRFTPWASRTTTRSRRIPTVTSSSCGTAATATRSASSLGASRARVASSALSSRSTPTRWDSRRSPRSRSSPTATSSSPSTARGIARTSAFSSVASPATASR